MDLAPSALAESDLEMAFGHPVREVTVTPIDPELRIHSVTGGVYRVTADNESLVIKIVRHGTDADPTAMWVSGADPSHRNYWRREWLAFDSGLLDDLPGQLRAPQCLLTTRAASDESWIWMEDVEGRPGASWQPRDYPSAAFDLGTTQGEYAAGHQELPDHEWLSHRWLRGWVEASGPRQAAVADDTQWTDARLQVLQPLRERAASVWQAREQLLTIVESAPPTVVHCDLWPTNLIAADDGTTVAIDWSQVGIGAVGQDIDQLVLDPVWMQVLPGQPIDELAAAVVPSYLAGLRHAGCDVSEDDLHLWYAAAAGMHYSVMLGSQPLLVTGPGRVESLERRWNRPLSDIVSDRARVIEYALDLATEALG